MKEVPSFLKWLQKYFYKIKHNGKSGGRVNEKHYVVHNCPITDITEMLKEEFSELKLYMKPQPVQYHDTTNIGWFLELHPEVDIPRWHKYFLVRVKGKVDDLDFDLVVKVIFNGERDNSSVKERSFVKRYEQLPKAVHLEVRSYQALEVTSELRKITESEAFQK